MLHMELLDTSTIVVVTNQKDMITYLMIYIEHLNNIKMVLD